MISLSYYCTALFVCVCVYLVVQTLLWLLAQTRLWCRTDTRHMRKGEAPIEGSAVPQL